MNITDERPFPLPQFEDRLWSELEQRHREPAVAPRAGRGPSPSGPRRRGRYLAVVGGLAAAVSLVAVAAIVATNRDEPDESTKRDPSTSASTASTEPTPSTTAAPAPAPAGEDAIAVTEVRDAEGRLVLRRWTDETTGNYRLAYYGDGEQLEREQDGVRQRFLMPGEGSYTGGQVTLTGPDQELSHELRQYMTFPAFNPPGGGGFEATGPKGATMVSQAIEIGDLVADGSEVIGGVEHPRYKGVEAVDAVPTAVWVDPASGRPVKIVAYGGSADETVATVTYLARTPDTIALADLVIPPDYTETDSLPGPGGSNIPPDCATTQTRECRDAGMDALNAQTKQEATLYFG